MMPETVISSDPSLLKLNGEELFARGTSAFAASEFDKAVRYFDRIVDTFPDSRHRREALYNSGLAHERLKHWEVASSRFTLLADAAHGKDDALDAAFRLAESEYQRGEFNHAIQLLRTVGARSDLSLSQRLEAQVQQGICELESGNPQAAEGTLRKSLEAYQSAPDKEGVDDYFPAQGQFFLGEIYRLRYEAVALIPEQGADKLSADLELKAELLLSAQGHYLRSIRMGNGYWATASGSEIGGLYENLYNQMVNAPTPSELKPDEARVYREELRNKIRVLLTKAITIYESTLEAAERIGTSGPFVEKTRESLKRMKDLLLREVRGDDAWGSDASKPPTPPDRRPRGLEPHTRLLGTPFEAGSTG